MTNPNREPLNRVEIQLMIDSSIDAMLETKVKEWTAAEVNNTLYNALNLLIEVINPVDPSEDN